MTFASPGQALRGRHRVHRLIVDSLLPSLSSSSPPGARLRAALLLGAGAVAGMASTARAAGGSESDGSWGDWWLPTNYSVHGGQIDMLFNWIFWITTIILIAVWVTMGVFLVKYRHRPDRKKAIFTHGNTRLEMIWTLIPAVILIVLALVTKRVWDNFRYSPTASDQKLAKILVIGQQFKWNVVYPGPDGKLGRYLIYPKTTDLKWPDSPPGEDPWDFGTTVPGPAYLPEADARSKLSAYIEAKNPLGKDFSDPDGKDDDWKGSLREVFLPKGRPIEINLSSRDVIHDFFSPNFRVKLDAVPGMRGLIYFTAVKSSADFEAASRKVYTLDELAAVMSKPNPPDFNLVLAADAPLPEGIKLEETDEGRRYYREIQGPPNKAGKKPKPKKETVAREGIMAPQTISDLRDAGFKQVTAYKPKYWDLVCEELCGQGHFTMQDKIIVLENDEYKKRFETPAAAPAAQGDATPPPAPLAVTK